MDMKIIVGLIILLITIALLLTIVMKSNIIGNEQLNEQQQNKCTSGFLSIFIKNSPQCEAQNEQSANQYG